jgi:glycine/D-amino acid oxidase-like deaminating enzyme
MRYAPLRMSIAADVVIVGAGITGAFMAHALARRYERVIVVDRREPMHGATSASTAMLQFEIDQPLTALAEKIGRAKAIRAWRRSFRATQDIVRLVEKEGLRCGLERRSSLYLAGNDMGARGLERESRARNRAGIPGQYLDRHAVRESFGIDRTGAIFSPKSAVANPVQLAAGLLRRAIEQGARVHAPVNIQAAFATPHGVALDAGEHFIEAGHVVFCTGYELLKGLPTSGTKITSSWAVASSPRANYPRWLDHTVVWEAASPYLYMRTTPDRRMIVGGEDEDIDLPSWRVRSLGRKSARLVSKAHALIPELRLTPLHQWSGAFGETTDGLPFIDAVPGMPNCFAVMGFGGNGTIYSMIAAGIMPGLLAGRSGADNRSLPLPSLESARKLSLPAGQSFLIGAHDGSIALQDLLGRAALCERGGRFGGCGQFFHHHLPRFDVGCRAACRQLHEAQRDHMLRLEARQG